MVVELLVVVVFWQGPLLVVIFVFVLWMFVVVVLWAVRVMFVVMMLRVVVFVVAVLLLLGLKLHILCSWRVLHRRLSI